MAKAKTTRKWINENFYCVSFGYCELQYLLTFQEPRFYTCGVYGWNFDAYTFGDYAITTGYRGMISNVKTPIDRNYNTVRDYNEKAKEIIKDTSIEYEDRKKKVNELLKDFLCLAFGVENKDRFYIY